MLAGPVRGPTREKSPPKIKPAFFRIWTWSKPTAKLPVKNILKNKAKKRMMMK